MGIIPTLTSRRLLAVLASVGVLAACGSDDGESNAGDVVGDEVLHVTATHSILGDIVASALGPAVAVDVVVPAGADPHSYSPSAREAELMENADLVVTNGLGFEEGLAPIVSSVAASGTPVFTFSDSLDTTGDPHVWMDPTLVVEGVEALGDEPSITDASIAEYVAELRRLDSAVDGILSVIPAERRLLVTNHDSFGYFADRYGFEVLGTVIPSVTTSAQTSAAELERLAALIREHHVPAIFVETTESDRLALALANEVGNSVEVVELYSGSLGEPGSGADTYVGYMTTNAERIAAALG